ncbi:MAG: quinone-dependent dihydroorotate dehydrogenase [Pseudomonadales bacterium]|nr:quinone-dependent dihydroorotate dehydrogenase [Pseudomonadales bacterium]
MYEIARQALFLLPAEASHNITLDMIRWAHKMGLLSLMPASISKPVSCMQLEFRNAVGLAAGLDKNATAVEGLMALGFGFVEVGTVTPRAQSGNPKPRLFRLPNEQAIINRMGFNNEGMQAMRIRLEAVRNRDKLGGGLIGVNIGKNKDTPNESAEQDYLACMDELYALADYLTVNLSSPNTPGLRELQDKDRLRTLLGSLRERQLKLADSAGPYTPLLVKIAPDLSEQAIWDVAEIVQDIGIDGVVATNTTITRPTAQSGRKTAQSSEKTAQSSEKTAQSSEKTAQSDEIMAQSGGFSGLPLFELSLDCVKKTRQRLDNGSPIIGVGGVSDPSSALRMQAAGASLIQIYSAFIYQGPELIRRMAAVL